jgi:hypothetical protein
VSASAPAPQPSSTVAGQLATLTAEVLPVPRAAVLGLAETWAYLGVLGGLVLVSVPILGSEGWRFRPPTVEPQGLLAPLVRAARNEWNPGLLRSAALLGGFLLAVYAVVALSARARRRLPLVLVTAGVLSLLVLPAVLLQAGLRDATAPWFFTNDSTYQIELAGDLVAEGKSPYGHDYGNTGLERFYSMEGVPRGRHVAVEHFAYFPGAALAAAAWNVLPSPWDDFRLFVALTTLGTFLAVLLFRAPLLWRLAAGALLVANPVAVRGAWFGNADAPGLLLLVLAFALATRSRYTAGAAALAAAVLFKQFALVALPFFAVFVLMHADRGAAYRAGGVFAGVLAAGIAPFVAADPAGFWADTVTYGVATYNILGYGLAGFLLRIGAIEDSTGAYPFFPLAGLVWLPATILLVRAQWRSREAWLGPAGFAVSIFLLVFLGRVFHSSYLVWPLAGLVMAALVAVSARAPVAQGLTTLPTRGVMRGLARGGRRRSGRRGAGDRPGQ